MKKLLVAAIGAAAAIGAFADPTPITALRFESATVGDTNTVSQLNTLHGGGEYWSDTGSADNTYVIETASSAHLTPLGTPTKALNVKTKFGNPLSVNVNAGGTAQTIAADGVYFDSLVKFTVCDDCPTNQYDGAKIVMWLQEDEAAGETNLYVNAGYLKYDSQQGVQVSNAIYKCGNVIGSDFADAWHRVTIKAIANITTSTSTEVPGFAIFIDGSGQNATRANSGDEKWDSSFTSQFTFAEAVEKLVEYDALFPSLDQSSGNKLTMTKASFDGTGSITDIAFYDESPETFADDFVAKKASVTIGTETTEYTSLGAALAAAAGQTATIQLMRGLTLDAPLMLSGAGNITFDFAGVVLTNEMDACAITNVGPAVVYTDSVGGGGIRCTSNGENAGAMYSADGGVSVTIEGGNFWGAIEYDPTFRRNVYISGGSFLSDQVTTLTPRLVSGKKFADEPTAETGLYEVVNKVSYTVKFISGEGSLTNEYTEVEGTNLAVPTPAAVAGKTFSAWDPAIAGETVTVEANATYTAQYTVNTYTVTFVDAHGTGGTVNDVSYGTVLSTIAPEIGSQAGYTAAWDTSLEGTVTDNITVTAVYTGKTFTIVTYTNGVENTSKEFTYAGESVDPADPLYDSGTETWDGKFYTENGGSTEFAFDAAGELTQNAYATIETKGGGVVPDIPAGGETDCGTAEAAAAAADAINKDAASKAAHIKVPTGAVAETYLGYVEAVAVGTKVTVDFTTAGAAAAQTSANTDVVSEAVSAAVAAAAAAGSEGSGTASVSTVAGFYYSIVSGTSPTAVTTEGTRVLGTGGSVNLTVPNKGPAGFYKVKVSARAAD